MSEEELELRRQRIVDRLIGEGIASGEPIEITDEYWDMKREVFLRRFRDGRQR